jgi:hypothetical protein
LRSFVISVLSKISWRVIRLGPRAQLEQDAVQLLVVVDVLLALLALDLVERRLGDVDVALVDQPGICR